MVMVFHTHTAAEMKSMEEEQWTTKEVKRVITLS